MKIIELFDLIWIMEKINESKESGFPLGFPFGIPQRIIQTMEKKTQYSCKNCNHPVNKYKCLFMKLLYIHGLARHKPLWQVRKKCLAFGFLVKLKYGDRGSYEKWYNEVYDKGFFGFQAKKRG
jgi:hypothetical protein